MPANSDQSFALNRIKGLSWPAKAGHPGDEGFNQLRLMLRSTTAVLRDGASRLLRMRQLCVSKHARWLVARS